MLGFDVGKGVICDDGDEDNNYGSGSANDDDEIDEDRKCMALITDIF